MTVDSTFDFERKRDEPLTYNRNTMVQTVQAMKKIQKIRDRRARDHILQRIKNNKAKQKGLLEREIARDIILVDAKLRPRVLEKIQQVQEEEEKEDIFKKQTIVQKYSKKAKAAQNSEIDIE